MNIKKIILELALLSVAAAVLAFTVNALSPKGIALVGDWNTKDGVVTAKAKNDVVIRDREIVVPQAKILFDQGVLFVDARSTDLYAAGHIKGAVSLPAEAFWDKIGAFKKEHPDSQLIVAYCSGRECTDSHDLAENLNNTGYPNVKVFVDGYPAWESEGLPVEK